MPLPPLTADLSLYLNSGIYFAAVPSGLPSRFPSTPCESYYEVCVNDAERGRTICQITCDNYFGGNCGCQGAYEEHVARCNRFFCAPGTQCQVDRQNPTGQPLCCPQNSYGCGGSCYPDCAPGFWPSLSTCQCECPIQNCPAPFILDHANCRCVCPPCPAGFSPVGYMQNMATCQCICPTGYTNCGDHCAQLGSNWDCARCGDRCSNGEECCPPDATNPNYHCVNVVTVANCGGC